MTNRVVCSAVAVLAAAVAIVELAGQSPAQLGAAPISHIGLVVRDVDAATKHFADVMGVPSPKVFAVKVGLPDGSQADLRYATVQLPNFLLEFEQPVSPSGFLHDHMQRFGQGIHHVGVVVSDGVVEKRAFLEQKGGKWTGGSKDTPYAFLDFKDALGTTIEIAQGVWPPKGAPMAVDPASPAPLGLRNVAHVGIAVTNTDTVAKAWSDVLGLPMPTVRDYKDGQYPPGHAWSMDAFIRLTTWKHANVGVELLGAVGRPNPWSDSVERFKGSTVQHIAIPVGPRLRESVAELQKKGGKWTNGKEGGSYAYLDFVDSFGLVFELNGSW